MKVFLVLPDLSKRKYITLQSLADKGILVDVLVSYTILSSKPSILPKLLELRQTGSIGEIMLDSGAYHIARLGAKIDPLKYSIFAYRWLDMWDYVVAPDVPGDPEATLKRTIEFARYYKDDFIPVIQGVNIDDYILMGEKLIENLGLSHLTLTGIGGLDGSRRKVKFISSLVERVLDRLGLNRLHLFGVGSRIVKALFRRGLLRYIYSIDTTAWLAEIVYRRKTVYGASNVVDANISAIIGYLKRVYGAINHGLQDTLNLYKHSMDTSITEKQGL